MRIVRTICSAVAIAAFLAPIASAQDLNGYRKTTFLTFSGPVAMPGMTLPAGTYKLELADPDGQRNVISVASKDGKQRFGMFLTIPDRRLEPADEPTVMFSERPVGTAEAVKAWYYPGQTTGYEFVYPHKQAIAIARANNTSVLASDTETSSASSKVARVDANGQSSSSTSAVNEHNVPERSVENTTAAPASTTAQHNSASQYPAASTAGNEPAIGTSGQASSSAAPARRGRRLPATASELALFELLSAVSLAGAWGVRRVRQGL